MRALVFVLMLSLPLAGNAAEVYKWRDKDGNIHYSDVEPPKQTAQRKVVKNKNAKALTPAEQAAKDKPDKPPARQAACEGAKRNVWANPNPGHERLPGCWLHWFWLRPGGLPVTLAGKVANNDNNMSRPPKTRPHPGFIAGVTSKVSRKLPRLRPKGVNTRS